MEHGSAKTREKDDDVCPGSSNRISQLPERVLFRILCFLSQKEALQTSVLSKSWRHLGPTRPLIDFRQSCVYPNRHVRGIDNVCQICFEGNKKPFLSLLKKTFQRYRDRKVFPQQLRLQMSRVDSQSISVLNKWIPIFINALTSLHLSIDFSPFFNLPSLVFKAKSLQTLFLQGCSFEEINSIPKFKLKNLRNLSLSGVRVSNEALEKLISGCPLVKRLVIDHCHGFEAVVINGDKNHCLDYFKFSYSSATCIEIDAPNLKSIRIVGSPNWYHNHVNYFPRLTSLYLSQVRLSMDSFRYFSCNFPSLRVLSLLYCCGYEEINLSSRSIERLIIYELRSWFEKVVIDLPNIQYFELSNGSSPITLSLATTSGEWKSNLSFHHCLHDHDNNDDVLPRILKLFGLVKAVSQSKISLTFFEALNYKMKTIEWDFNDKPVVVEHLDLSIMNRQLGLDSLAHVLNVLLRIFRPRYMAEKSEDSDKEVTMFLWKTLIHEREKTKYGWEQHLEEVSIKASDEEGKVWRNVEYLTCLPEWSKDQEIRFRLKWRD